MFRDCDYIKTRDGIFFIVFGDYHPKDKIRAVAVYFPDNNGDRIDRITGLRYVKKIEQFPELDLKITKLHPEYLLPRDDLIGIGFFIPVGDVEVHYRPREKTKGCLDNRVLQNTKWEKLILSIHGITGVPIEDIGIYGSTLIGLVGDNSDVDLLVYGQKNLEKLKNKFESVLLNSEAHLATKEQRVARVATWKKYAAISQDRLQRMESRRWSRVNVCRDDITSIRFAYGDGEVPSDLITSPIIKEIRISGEVKESINTHFTPKVARVSFGDKSMDVVSYHFLSFSCVRDGDKVEIWGNYRKDGQREYITIDSSAHYMCPIEN